MHTPFPVTPAARGRDYGSIALPGSKSITNRFICLAPFAGGTTILRNPLLSDDTIAGIACLRALGVRHSLDRSRNVLEIHGDRRTDFDGAELFFGSAGTLARFLPPMLAIAGGTYRFDGTEQLRARPMSGTIAGLRRVGVAFEFLDRPEHLPFVMTARAITTDRFNVDGRRSSQFVSGLLMAAAVAGRAMTVTTSGNTVAKPYLDITIEVIERLGGAVDHDGYRTFRVDGTKALTGATVDIEGDASSAAYFFAAAALLGGTIEVTNVPPASKQGDLAFLDVLARMGCTHRSTASGVVLTGPPDRLGGVDVDLNDMSDQTMTLAVLGVAADRPVTIRNVGHIQHQESRRLAACTSELRRLGIRVDARDDGLRVFPGTPKPTVVRTYDDHRIAMAFAVLGLRFAGIAIENPDCTAKTFPAFFTRFPATFAPGAV